jgi:hypothetical protein
MTWQEQHFDKHQFAGKRTHAVSADTEISFQDFGRMHIEQRKVTQVRRLPTPAWALNDASLRETVLRYCEDRLYLDHNKGTDEERLARIDADAKRRLPALQQIFDGLQARYTREAAQGQSANELDRLRVEIQSLDTAIVLLKRGIVALALAVAHYYYWLGWNSAQIANELGVKPPMVRQWCRRMNIVAGNVGDQKRGWGSRENLQRLFVLRMTGRSLKQSAAMLGISAVAAQEHWKRYFLGLKTSLPRGPRKARVSRKTRKPWDAARLKQLFTLRAKGHTWRACAELMDATSSTLITHWRANFGPLRVTRKPKKERARKRQPARLKPRRDSKTWTRWVPARIERLARERRLRGTWEQCAKALDLNSPHTARAAWFKYCKAK